MTPGWDQRRVTGSAARVATAAPPRLTATSTATAGAAAVAVVPVRVEAGASPPRGRRLGQGLRRRRLGHKMGGAPAIGGTGVVAAAAAAAITAITGQRRDRAVATAPAAVRTHRRRLATSLALALTLRHLGPAAALAARTAAATARVARGMPSTIAAGTATAIETRWSSHHRRGTAPQTASATRPLPRDLCHPR